MTRPQLPELRVDLALPGEFNVRNALAAIAVAGELGVDDTAVCKALAEFAGIGRRFQRRGEVLTRIRSDLTVAHGSLGLLFSEVARSALTIVVGVIALTGMPGSALWVIGILVGVEMLSTGVARIATAWQLRELAKATA